MSPKKKSDQAAIPRGKPVSGRIWKSEKKKFSSIIKSKGLRQTLEKKQQLRNTLKRVKEASNAVKASNEEQKELKKQRRRDNLKRRAENDKKGEVVQVITNSKKLKKMKKKQLRNVEKRDTTTVG